MEDKVSKKSYDSQKHFRTAFEHPLSPLCQGFEIDGAADVSWLKGSAADVTRVGLSTGVTWLDRSLDSGMEGVVAEAEYGVVVVTVSWKSLAWNGPVCSLLGWICHTPLAQVVGAGEAASGLREMLTTHRIITTCRHRKQERII